jgi:hypothetical protein
MTYKDFITYLTSLASSHKQIQDTIVADYEDIVSRQRTTMKYPCFWVESPRATFIGDSDSLVQSWSGAFVILTTAGRTPLEQLDHLEEAYKIARSIILRIQHEVDEGIVYSFRLNNRTLEAINPIFDDNSQGWRFSFEIVTTIPAHCYDPDEWHNDEDDND